MKVSTRPVRRLRLLPAILSFAILAACGSGPAVKPDQHTAAAVRAVTIKLIALNDFHGHLAPPPSPFPLPAAESGKTVDVPLGGVAYVATEVKALEAVNANHIVVGAGDLISASPLESALFHDESSITAMGDLGLEFSSVGNHEFDRGREGLLRIQNGGCAADGKPGKDTCIGGNYTGAPFRYLAANVIDESTSKAILPAYGVKEFATAAGVVKIAFIGVVIKSVPDLVARAGIQGLRFEDEADTVNALIPEIRKQGINSIVVLIHEGGKSTGSYNDHDCPGFTGKIIDIVNRLDPAVDAVISAHTHQAYVCRLASRDPARRILVTSAGSYGRFVTDVDLSIDPLTGKVLSANANNIAIVNDTAPNPAPDLYTGIAPDPTLAALVADYAKRAAPTANRVIGRIKADLDNHGIGGGESALGMVIADAQLEATSARKNGGAQIAFMNSGGVRSPLLRGPKGDVTFGQIYSAQPFGSHLVTVTLTGEQIHTVLEAQWHSDGTDAVLSPSKGFTYRWKKDAPVGTRVDAASMRLDGKPVKPAATYRVNVSDFLGDGGDAFKTFTEGTHRKSFEQVDRDVLIGYIARHSPLAAPVPGRIKRVE